MPFAVAAKPTDAPTVTFWLAGCRVNDGAMLTGAVLREITVAEYGANEALKVAPEMAMLDDATSGDPLPAGLAALSCGIP